MPIFHFLQYEHELFCWYFKRLNAFLAQCEYYVSKWEILGIVDEGLNSKTQIPLQFWDFHLLNVDDAWSGIHLNLKRLAVFVDILFLIHVHFMLDHTMLLCSVICVILLPIMLAHVLIMLVMPSPTRLYL